MKTLRHNSTTNPITKRIFKFGSSVAFAGALISSGSSLEAASYWKGVDGIGGDGTWLNSNFSPTGTPTSSTDVWFDYSDTYTTKASTVTIGVGVAARAKSIVAMNGKEVLLKLSDTSSLTVGTGVIGVSANAATIASSSSLTIEGPATGSATVTAVRLFLENNTANVGTAHRNALVLSGSNLSVALSGTTYNGVNGRSSITITNGASVVVNGASGVTGGFYSRTGNVGSVYDNFISIQNGSLKAGYARVEGLFQLGAAGSLGTSASATTEAMPVMTIEVRKGTGAAGGRFEVEGSGLAADVITDVWIGGTLAVGLSDPLTGTRTTASSVTLDSHVKLKAGSFLELGIFGPGANDADRIFLGETGKIENFGTGGKLVLTLHSGFVPEYGQTYTLLDIDPLNLEGIVGNFDLSGIDTTIWDLSSFNEAGGWAVTSIPEPGTNALLGALALAGCCWKFGRRKSQVCC